jgi:hypothetical protein
MKTIFTIITSTILLVPIQFSSGVAAEEKLKIEKEQVGRFTLHIVNKGELHILYRIDTVTGNVSIFDPYTKTTISDVDIDKISTNPIFIKGLRDKGHLILENSFWKKLPEKLESIKIELNEKQ